MSFYLLSNSFNGVAYTLKNLNFSQGEYNIDYYKYGGKIVLRNTLTFS